MKPSRRGISMVEVLVALVLLALAIPMVAGFSTTSKKIQVAANEMENAAAAAQLVLDSLALYPAFMIDQGSPKSRQVQGPVRMYDASWTFFPVGRHGGVVVVKVAWNQAGADHNISITGAVP